MADQPLLEVNCANCPRDQACEDCLVRFFLTVNGTAVVPLARRGAGRRVAAPGAAAHASGRGAGAALPPDLAEVMALLEAAGLEPELLAVEAHDSARAS